MKKVYIPIIVVLAVLLAGCETRPYADFYADAYVVGVNDRVNFTNVSSNADYYEWDFGDGTYSNRYKVSHSYAEPGIYRVELRAYDNDDISIANATIEVVNTMEFEASTTITDIGYNIQFTNYSEGADYYIWDFGDGTTSQSYDAVHAYASYNDFVVTLTGYDNGQVIGQASLTVSTYPTDLEIQVLEWYDEYAIFDASVILYPSYKDWLNQTNSIVEGFTDEEGYVTFTEMSPKSYYIDAWHPDHNNYQLADEDIAHIKTEPLIPGYINTFVSYVDYVENNGKNIPRIELKRSEIKTKSGKVRTTKSKPVQDKKEHKKR
ncbi:MAG: PKD domain-containing protein [Bacteroidetes bacterium]|nr:PKD domain-containing protein [Bacteroidota bacterium]